ncbi:hypothetical protein Tco_1567591 [Tanacetum coccineum]
MVDVVPGRAMIDVAQRKREADAVTLLKQIRKLFMAQDIGARAAVHIFNRISFAIAKGVGAQRVSWLPSNLLELENDVVALLKGTRKFFVDQDVEARAAVHIFSKIGFDIARGVRSR